MNHDAFYNQMADALGLPHMATEEGWEAFGRKVIPRCDPRTDFCGQYYFGLEDTYVARGVPVEEKKEEPKRVQTLGDLLRQAMARGIGQTKTPTLDKLENTSEPKRAPLDWNKSTPFDQFKGFTVKCDTGPMVEEAKSPLTLSSDLKACGHQVDWKHGTAHR